MSDLTPSPVSGPMGKWFASKEWSSTDRWRIREGSLSYIILNPRFPDSVDLIARSFPLLPVLVNKYMAIDRLNSTETQSCSMAIEAIDYILRFDGGWGARNTPGTINSWREYMKLIEEEVVFAPNFTQWDKHAREIERLANDVLAESMKVAEEHNRPERRLPKEIKEGIYVRTSLLQRWMKSHLHIIRDREDYKTWKAEQDILLQPTKLRKRRGYPTDGGDILTTETRQVEIPKRHAQISKPQIIERYLQDDLAIWSINLAIYISSTIIQAISFSNQTPSRPSTSDYLNAVQTTLTQLLSVLMTYILTVRNSSGQPVKLGYRLWFVLAGILPIVACSVFKWYAGLSAMLMFLSTATTGFLQVLLAVDIKRSKVLP